MAQPVANPPTGEGSSSRQVELTEMDLQLIGATLICFNRLNPRVGQANRDLARKFLTRPLNLTEEDGRLICAQLGALSRDIRRDPDVAVDQRTAVRNRCEEIIQKFTRGRRG